MKKQKFYSNVVFTTEVLKASVNKLKEIASCNIEDLTPISLTIEHDDATWNHDSLSEFYADYSKYSMENDYELILLVRESNVILSLLSDNERVRVRVSVTANSRSDVEEVFQIFEGAKEQCAVKEKLPSKIKPTIFIGHGRSDNWKKLKDHLSDKHGYSIEAYETGARAGHTIRDILEEMLNKSSFALLVLTSEDSQEDGGMRARQNVIHEAGLFQGKLGFSRAILLLEDSVEKFSNIDGVQYIRFTRNNIKETYGEVLATLRREFGENDYPND